ncbi:hypothetical protein Pcinc_036106 [Petrolisthes cinctipes]|uniref:Queuine tRNA-ribosyltransferase catalytic subunit 1 n=1 Tax=Petrolisthes cinctipes TaxID=88211 RepID=A0AAE1EMX4_PETCI|nr:hypothetical protein Pcinc_036106 [Petrolisthes cinctipes]
MAGTASTAASTFLHSSSSPALKFRVVAQCSVSRARASVMTLPHHTVHLPTFMPVGTQGTMKGLLPQQVKEAGAEIILGNTYHLGTRPGKESMKAFGGLHQLMGWDRALLTDSGGFQMVSLSALSKVTEEGVKFQSPYDGTEILLTPEESIAIQNAIGADIMMQLDDVVDVMEKDYDRFKIATHRTTRWLDRCMEANKNPQRQNLFPIVQGGLHPDLRATSLDQLIARDAPGYAIGGLSGGEAKDQFWRVILQCTGRLPPSKPRYCMGVGFAVDLVVCCALGADMYDCVFPTRTARFGCALIDGGQLNLKNREFAVDFRPIDDTCSCSTCTHYTRAYIHTIVTKYPVACHLLSVHNVAYQMRLMDNIRSSIIEDNFPTFVQDFMAGYYKDRDYPTWLTDALAAVNIHLKKANIHNQEGVLTSAVSNREGNINQETQKSDEGTDQRNSNEEREVIKTKIGAEALEDDGLDESDIIKGNFWDHNSRILKLKQVGYRDAILDDYPDQEKAGQAAGWRAALASSQSKTNLVLTLSQLAGALMALKVKQSLTQDQDKEVRELLKEVERKVKMASQSDSPYLLTFMKQEIGEAFEKEINTSHTEVNMESGLISSTVSDGAFSPVSTNTAAATMTIQNQSLESEANSISVLQNRVQTLYQSCGLDTTQLLTTVFHSSH